MSTTARAALLPHYDLTSLAFQAKNVVRAKQTSEKKIDEYTTLRTMVVIANYKGDLVPGATFTVSTDGYSLESFGELFDPPAKPAVVAPEMIFFLGPKGEIVPSGLRIFRDGKAQRFAQFNNPGGYYPIPQGLDPWDMCGDPRARASVDLAALEAQIAVALRRAAAVKRALHAPDLGRLVGEITELGEEPACYDDAVARAILDELAERNDLPALLDAASRTKETGYRFPLRADVHEHALLAAAENRGLPLTSRLAALRVLREHGHFLFNDATLDARFVALVSDPEPRIRAAALVVRGGSHPSSAMKTAIRSVWAVETDDRVRVALVRAAAREKISADLMTPGTKWPVFAVYSANGQVLVPWADADPKVSLRLVSAKITMKGDGRTQSANLSMTTQMMTGGGEGIIGASIVFEPPLAPGVYDAEVAIVLDDQQQGSSKSVKKTVKLGKLLAPSALAIPPPVNASTFPIEDPALAPEPAPVVPSATATATATAPPTRPIPPKHGGCACEVRPRRGGGTLELLASIAMLGVLVARRSHRSRA
jgi:hypothetical protein